MRSTIACRPGSRCAGARRGHRWIWDQCERQGRCGAAGRQSGQFAWHADGFDRHTGDYDTPDGTQGNSFFRGDGYSAGGSYFFGENRVGLGVVTLRRQVWNTERHHIHRHAADEGTPALILRRGPREAADGERRRGLRRLPAHGAGSRRHGGNPPSSTRSGTRASKPSSIRWGRCRVRRLGVQVQHKNFSALARAPITSLPTTTQSEAFFAFTELPLAKEWKLQAAARVEHVTVEGTPLSGDQVSRPLHAGELLGRIGVRSSRRPASGIDRFERCARSWPDGAVCPRSARWSRARWKQGTRTCGWNARILWKAAFDSVGTATGSRRRCGARNSTIIFSAP